LIQFVYVDFVWIVCGSKNKNKQNKQPGTFEICLKQNTVIEL